MQVKMADMGQSLYSFNVWVTEFYIKKPGFTKLLWPTMQSLGYDDFVKPLYTWKESVTEYECKCELAIQIPSCAAHLE
jgi:hypothetical protein